MRDMGHCMMPFDKDDEFGMFYDFSRAYVDLPQKPMLKANGEEQEEDKGDIDQEAGIKLIQGADNEESDDWEDVDCDDGESEELEEVKEMEEESSEPSS